MSTAQDSFQFSSETQNNSVPPLREENSSGKSGNSQGFRVSLTKNRYEIESDASVPIAQVREFLAQCEIKGLSPQTFRAYAYDLLGFLRWWDPGDVALEDLTQSHLLRWVSCERSLSCCFAPHRRL